MQSDDLGLVRYGVVAHDDGSDRMEPVARGQWVGADEAAAAIERLVAEARQAALGEDVANALLQRSRDHVDRLKEALRETMALVYAPAEDIKDAVLSRARQALKDAP